MNMHHASLFQTNFPPAEFSSRRSKVFDSIGNDALAVLQGASVTSDLEHFRQLNDFYYLCGVEVPDAYLLLDGRNRQTTLYLPRRDPQKERSEGPLLNADDAEQARIITGVNAVRSQDELPQALAGATTTCTLFESRHPGDNSNLLNRQPTRRTYFIDKLKALCPNATIQDLSQTVEALRLIKSSAEIDVMRRAGRLTALAVAEAMRCTRPGLIEYQLGAVADYIFRLNGARGGGYPPIIAGGQNAWHGHYFRNTCELKNGDLVLMDYAPDYRYYTSDIGRMWPINGTYSAWQRELYGFIVVYHKALLKRIRPGALAAEIMDEAAVEMKEVIDQTTFSKPSYEKSAREALAFRGHLSHSVGMDVHDSGNYHERPLLPGLVFAVDPMMWIPEERLYIRVEDTIVVTESGIENLTQLAPLELNDVEEIMKEDGMIQKISLFY